jgi:hypothetical protein
LTDGAALERVKLKRLGLKTGATLPTMDGARERGWAEQHTILRF